MDKEIDGIIEDLKNEMQTLEDLKQMIDETLLDIRNTISLVMMMKMEAQQDG